MVALCGSAYPENQHHDYSPYKPKLATLSLERVYSAMPAHE